MSNHSDTSIEQTDDETGTDQEPVGAEIGMTDDGSTFEPEEDPEGHGS